MNEFDINTADNFGFCHVFYDENDKCEAIEIFDEVEVYVNAVGRRKRRT